MAKKINHNSILFLYEGETEREFYVKLINMFIQERVIRINYGNLNGVYNLNKKVSSKIQSYLKNDNFTDCNSIHVYIAYDREGDRSVASLLNIEDLKNSFIGRKSRIKSINEIIATQDLESWFFHDLKNIYAFLKVPSSKRTLKYKNVEATNNRILSQLFHSHKNHYQKGRRVAGFIDKLDLQLIYNNVVELQEAIDHMKTLYKTKK